LTAEYPGCDAKAKGACHFDYLAAMRLFRPRRSLATRTAPLLLSWSITVWSVTAAPAASAAQQPADVLDVGSFTLFVDDQRAGREQFSMRQSKSADGTTYELRSESATGDRRSAVRLEADSAGTPLRYSVEERTGATVSLRLGGQRVRGRFTTLSRSVTGEAAREYLLLPGTMVLERDGVLQYALLVRRTMMQLGDSTSLAVLTPTTNQSGRARLTLESLADTVVVAGSRRAARRWRVVSHDDEERLIWADDSGRLLRVRIPARRFEALRDDVPR
jgi:hypothetical protein